ncbi:hypothetical protein HDV06_000034 [Boothiomyces sp. JEL0866]|nr:hypothetical protein HDV06_000034 [Boothiomyces sp. JEL0866]
MSANIVLLSAWDESYLCSGPPTSMYLFSEDWAIPLYNFTIIQNPIPYCGSAPAEVPTGCCISSLDLSQSYNTPSYTNSYVNTLLNGYQSMPQGASGHDYCSLILYHNSSLGYWNMYYLADRKCRDGGIICDANRNQISIFEQSDCKGNSENISITSDYMEYNSSILGNIQLSKYQADKPGTQISWITYEPQNLLTPTYTYVMDYVALLLFVGAMAISVCSIAFYIRSYFRRGKKQDLLFALNQFFIGIKTIFSFIYLSLIFEDNNIINYFTIARELSNIQSLFSVYTSLLLLSSFWKEYQQSYQLKLIYVIFTLLHFGLSYWLIPGIVYNILTGGYSVFYMYYDLNHSLSQVWNFIYLLIEALPSLVILLKVVRVALQKKSNNTTGKVKKMVILSISQLVLIILYLILSSLTENTNITGSDHTFLTVQFSYTIIFPLNSIFNILLFEYLKETTSLLVKRKPTPNAMGKTIQIQSTLPCPDSQTAKTQ